MYNDYHATGALFALTVIVGLWLVLRAIGA